MTKKFSPRCNVIKDKQGLVQTQSAEILNTWKTYTSELYEEDNRVVNIQKDISNDSDSDTVLEPLRSEVEIALRGLKNDKALGCDDLPAELMKAAGEEGISILHKLCVKVWKTGILPIDWTRALFVPLPKKG